MNKRQKEVAMSQLKDEEKVIKKLKATYNKAIKDINQKIRLLQADKLTQSKIYQIEYQKALKMQIKAILDNMNANQYNDIQEYLKNCYHEGFLGTMYDLQGQGIPLVFPIDQNQVVKALVNDTKLSKSLHESLGFNVNTLKKQINGEISRGIANWYSYDNIARNVANKTNMTLRRSIRIARTEGHRIQQQATFDAQKGAKERGADIVKQWDSTMDKKTRPNHVKLDGQIREIEDPFEVNGKTAMFPANFGVPHEDINCRCVMLQRARWGLDDEETTKMNNETGEIVKIKEKDFESFKQKYLNAILNGGKMNLERSIKRRDSNSGAFSNLKIPMQKRAVRQIARKYSIDLSGITMKIQRSESLISLPITGSTDYMNIGRIDLFPNAFIDEEQLARTLIHETCHVNQLKKYGVKYVQNHLSEMEKEAYFFEKTEWEKKVKK